MSAERTSGAYSIVTPVLVLVFLACGTVAAAAQETEIAEPQLVDRILAIVDEEMILQSDLERETEIYRLERAYAGEEITASEGEIREEILARLVESKLIIAAAKQADIHIEEEAISQGVEEKITQLTEHLGSREDLERELARSNLTLDDYRDRLAAQLSDQHYLRAVIARFIRPEVEVLENEIVDYFHEHEAEIPATADSVTLAHILIPVQPELASRQAVQRKVQLVLQALEAGQSFADAARTHSEGPNAARGGTVGVIKQGDLFDSNLEAAVFSLPEGGVSPPLFSQQGVHLMRVDAITPRGRAISQIFFPLEVTEGDVAVAREQAQTTFARLQAGEAFSLVAAEVSGDPATARQGGHLGSFRLEDLSHQFQEVLQDRQAGELTEPLLMPAGFYIFLVKERTVGRRLTFEEVKESLRRALEAEKLEKELSGYVESLRKRFFIDLKG